MSRAWQTLLARSSSICGRNTPARHRGEDKQATSWLLQQLPRRVIEPSMRPRASRRSDDRRSEPVARLQAPYARSGATFQQGVANRVGSIERVANASFAKSGRDHVVSGILTQTPPVSLNAAKRSSRRSSSDPEAPRSSSSCSPRRLARSGCCPATRKGRCHRPSRRVATSRAHSSPACRPCRTSC